MSQLAPELILLRAVLEVTVKSFTVLQTALRKRSGCVLCVCNMPVPKRLDLHLTVISLVLADTCSVPTGFNSFLSGDLTADPFRPHNRHKCIYLTLSCKLPQYSVTVSIFRGSSMFFKEVSTGEREWQGVICTLLKSDKSALLVPHNEKLLQKPQPKRDKIAENMSQQFTYLEYHPPKSTTRGISSL